MSLSVLTLNIWGLWLVSKKREQRVRHLCSYLQSCKEDVILLQEVWVDSDAQLLIKAGRAAGLSHSTHFRSGVFGAGLVTLSRHPIIRHGFWRYAASGFATSISCGDYYAGKGVGWVRLSTPLGEADIFNTHLHANYCHDYRQPEPHLARAAAAAIKIAAVSDSDPGTAAAAPAAGSARGPTIPPWAGSRIPDDDDAGTRISQLLELSEIIRLVFGSSSDSSSSRLLVLGGDLNCKPDTLEVDLLRLRLPELQDAWLAAAEHSSSGSDGSTSSNPEGYTSHAPGNTYQPRRQVPQRIDYIWTNMACSRMELALQMSPGGMSYSDHFAVRATLAKPDSSSGDAKPGLGPMKLGSSGGKQQQEGEGKEGGGGQAGSASGGVAGIAMDLPKRMATIMAAQMLLEEGMRCFGASTSVMSMLGGFCLTSVVYCAVALPLLLPDVVFRGWMITLAFLAVGFFTFVGVVALLMGQVADKSQKRALQNSYRQLRVWMQEVGLDVPYSASMQLMQPE